MAARRPGALQWGRRYSQTCSFSRWLKLVTEYRVSAQTSSTKCALLVRLATPLSPLPAVPTLPIPVVPPPSSGASSHYPDNARALNPSGSVLPTPRFPDMVNVRRVTAVHFSRTCVKPGHVKQPLSRLQIGADWVPLSRHKR